MTSIWIRLLRRDLLLELIYRNSLGDPNSFSVCIIQELPLWHELRHVVENAFHEDGDNPQHLQRLLSEKRLSLAMRFNGASIF